MGMAAEVGDAAPRPIVVVRHSVDPLKVRHVLRSRDAYCGLTIKLCSHLMLRSCADHCKATPHNTRTLKAGRIRIFVCEGGALGIPRLGVKAIGEQNREVDEGCVPSGRRMPAFL